MRLHYDKHLLAYRIGPVLQGIQKLLLLHLGLMSVIVLRGCIRLDRLCGKQINLGTAVSLHQEKKLRKG